MAGGRPTLYQEDYPDKLIKHMADGFSFEAFAGLVGVCVDTLYEWEKVHPQFSEAKKVGFAKSRLTWEKIGKEIAKEGQGNATAFVFNMKNRFPKEWRDKQEIEQRTEFKAAIQIVPDDRNEPIAD